MKHSTLTFRPRKANKMLLLKIAEMAKEDNRTLNNFIEKILLDYIKANKK
jgi:hypothetical protein